MTHFQAPPFLTLPAVQTVFALARQAGGEARLVGGCVRDYILARTHQQIDIDMAVNLPIATLIEVAETAGIRVLASGLAHGSVTLMIEQMKIEVTQTRADIAPDGRHTQIGFTADWQEDAHRRDFTINALYIDGSGHLHDDVGGMADLKAMNLRFIGHAAARIDEDYLRILRAVRFCAQMPELSLGSEALAAMMNKAPFLQQLSGERIHAELYKSLSAKGWEKAVDLMRQTQIDTALFGVSFSACDADLIALSAHHRWLVILASTLPPEVIMAQRDRLRLSNAETHILSSLIKPFSDDEWALLASDKWAEYAYHEPVHLAERALVFMARYKPSVRLDADLVRQIDLFDPPPCPVTGHELIKAGVPAGQSMGVYVQRAKSYFAASQFTADKEAILSYLLDS